MKCLYCGKQMIQGGDHDTDEEEFIIVSNFSCPRCGSFALFYFPNDEEEKTVQ
tara:strand:+ start:5145 stop:5303 length:159 start_codon:yes stop_codon:yes gene_type:complete